MLKKLTATVLALALVVAMLPAASAATYSDVHGHWAEDAIFRLSELGILTGYEDGTFRPDQTVSHAELATILNRLLGFPAVEGTVAGMDASAWYYDGVSALLNQRFIYAPNGDFNAAATREQAVYMIANAFGLTSYKTTPGFTDDDDVSEFIRPFLVIMRNLGYLGGYSDGTFRPHNTITRAEVVTILDNMVDVFITQPGEYTFADRVSIAVLCQDVTLNLNTPTENPPTPPVTYGYRVFIAPGAQSTQRDGTVIINCSGAHANKYTCELNANAVSGNGIFLGSWIDIKLNFTPVLTDKTPSDERMMLAAGAMLNYINSSPTEQKALPTSIDLTPGNSASSLSNGWGVNNHDDVVYVVDYLARGDGHTNSYFEEVNDVLALTPEQLALYKSAYSDGYLFDQMLAWNDKWGDTGIIAWDLFRASNVALWGYKVDYITRDEALALFAPASTLLAEHFDTWDEAYDNYLDGYAWWSRSDISEGRPRETYWESMKIFYPDVFDDSLLS
ncbi:MAG: S-layer homology domain-containing protein [Oscillospiraceae bacterium]|nr:S-layer homology domain-containing protein [Oscillospiraceae bacterium]